MTNSIHQINLVNIEDIKYKKKIQKNDLKVGIGKMKIKHGLLIFSNARSINELMLCNQNLTKLLYPTLLSSNCRA